MTTPAPGTTVQVPIQLGDIDASLAVDLRLAANSNLDTQPRLQSDVITFDVDPYVIVDGQPVQQGGFGATFLSRAATEGFTRVTTPPDPLTLPMGAFARWLPLVGQLDSPANGGRRWWPQGSPRTVPGPRMSLTTVIPVGQGGVTTGRGTYGVDSPYVHPTYTYQGNGRLMQRPAMVFDGKGAAAIEPDSLFLSCTVAMVAVFQDSRLPYQGIFEHQVLREPGEPLVMRYSHGRLDVFQSHSRIVSHETVKPDAYPVLFMLSMDSDSNTGRLLVQDQNRTTRLVNIAGLEYISLSGILGAVGQGTTASPWRNPANFDLLELDIWNRFMDWPEIESKANLLSLAYGLAPR